MRNGAWCAFVALSAVCVAREPLTGQSRTVLVGATLIDGTGAPPIAASRVVIDAGRVSCVSGPDGCAGAPGDRTVALTGSWLSPGLIDTHAHIKLNDDSVMAMRAQRLRFALGITTVRDADTRAVGALLPFQDAAEDPNRQTPRLVIAAHATQEYANQFGVPLVVPLVERLAAMGVDAIKIKGSNRWREEIRAARSVGLPAYGHTWSAPARPFIREALAEGISGITHLMAFGMESQPPGSDSLPPEAADDVWRWFKDRWLTASQPRLDSLAREVIARGVWLEPTLAAEYHWGNEPLIPASHDFLRRPAGLRAMLESRPSSRAAAYPESWVRQAAFVGDFIRRGGMVVAGSDGLDAGIDLHEEIRLIGEVAGSPLAGLLAATRDAATAVGRADVGTVEPGKLADLVVYSADPLAAPMATLAITGVIKGGVIHDADTLQAEFRNEHRVLARAAWKARLRKLTFAGVAVVAAGLALVIWRRRRRAT